MGRKLTIPYYRPTFVEKTIGEVGDGTAWPMECTLDQIAEIFYRVKDAWFTEGGVSFDYFGAEISLQSSTSAPANRAFGVSASTLGQTRGYTVLDSPALSAHNQQYLGEPYPAVKDFMAIDGGTYTEADYRDIADDELGIWIQGATAGSIWGLFGEDYLKSAFDYSYSYSALDYSPPPVTLAHVFRNTFDDGINPVVENFIEVSVGIDRGVAYVLADPSDNLFSPNTRFFLGVRVFILAGVAGALTIIGDTDLTAALHTGAGPLASLCNYVIRLSSGDIYCPIYFTESDGITEAAVLGSPSDFIHEATEWWPYDKDGSGTNPAWSPLTGLPL